MPKSPPSYSRKRKWLFRLAPLVILLALPLLAEAALRILGVGCSTSFLVRKGDYWFPNDKFAVQFFGPRGTSRPVYFKVPVDKPAGTMRIVVLGESAAMGTPDPAFSFGRILEVMLEAQRVGEDASPYLKVELVNAAMRGIDSHVVRKIARDCARLKPDVFVVYMGNNEVIGLHGPEPGCSRFSQSLWVMRAGQFLKGTRIGQWVGRASSRASTTQDMEFFRKHRLQPDDWRREAVRRNFAANLKDVVQAGTRAGAKVIVSTVPVNVKDFPPLGSLPGQKNAEEQFRLAQKFLAAGDTNQASAHFERALDWDALQFRADSPLNHRIREIAEGEAPTPNLQPPKNAQVPGSKLEAPRFAAEVELVDAVKVFAEADGGIPGAKLFRDHVHPTFEGDYLLAKTLLPAVERALRLLTSAATVPSSEECAKFLAYSEWHDAQIQLAMADLTSKPPYHDQLDYRERQARAEKAARERLAQLTVPQVEAALQTALAAVKRRPDDWLLRHNCAQLYQALGRPAGAVEHLEAITKIFPHVASFQMLLGQTLAAAGRIDAAIFHFEQAAKLDPKEERAKQVLAELRKRARKK